MAKKETNRLGLRSKERLTEAFFKLLAENPEQKINIKKLCEKANVTRPTFYAHYQIIEEIPFEFIYGQIHALYTGRVNVDGIDDRSLEQSGLEYVYDFFGYWSEKERIFLDLKSADMEAVILEIFKKLVTISAKVFFIQDLSDPVCREFILNYHAYAIFQLLDFWFESGKRNSLDEIIDIFTTLLHTDIVNHVVEKIQI